MSNDVPPSAPGSPEPDPFAELLKGLVNEPEPPAVAPGQAPAQPTAPAQPVSPWQPAAPAEPDLPPTEALAAADLPNATFPPTAAFPPAATFPPTEALEPTEPARPFPQTAATSAYTPTDATLAYSPTDATSVYAPTSATSVFAASGGGDQPTELLGGFGHVPPAETSAWSLAGDEREPLDTRRKVVVGILIGLAALLVIAIAILLTNLAFANGGGAPAPAKSSSHAPSDSASPSAAASDSPSPSDTPVPMPAITNFVADSPTVQCPYDRTGTQQVLLSWSATDASYVAVASSAAAVDDATQQPFESNLDANVSGFAIPYSCSNAKWVYTLTAVGADGSTVTQPLQITAQYAAPPKPTPSPTPTPQAPAAKITSFKVTDNVTTACASNPTPDLTFTWSTQNAVQIWLGIDSDDTTYASDVTASNGTDQAAYQCGAPHTYYLIVLGQDGNKISQTVQVSG